MDKQHNDPPQSLWDLEMCLYDIVREVEALPNPQGSDVVARFRGLVSQMDEFSIQSQNLAAKIVAERLGAIARAGIQHGSFGGPELNETADLIIDLHRRIQELEDELQSRS
jgi:hypothetical protein